MRVFFSGILIMVVVALVAPLWDMVIFFLIPMLLAIWWPVRAVVISGHCRECGYNLTGNESGICPECGTEVTLATKRKGADD